MKHRMSPFEESVLLVVMELTAEDPKGAYGVPIKRRLNKIHKKDINIGTIYGTLGRFERKGYVSVTEGDPTPERGGRSKRYFAIEAAGVKALRESREASRTIYDLFDRIWGQLWKAPQKAK